MLALEPRFDEEVIFRSGDTEIKIKFYLGNNNKLRIAITAPHSVTVIRKKIKVSAEIERICMHHIRRMFG